jgi:hypothetical protein
MDKHTRSAFSRIGDVLEHSIEYLSRVAEQLEKARPRELPERVRMLLSSFEADQRNLLAALERYVEDAADKVSDTYISFYSPLPEEVSVPEDPLTTLSLTLWLEEMNQHLIDVFTELAATAASADVKEAMTALADMVQAHDRRLSKEYQRGEDL